MSSQKDYRLGVIGFAHMHVNSLVDSFAEIPNVKWVACADTVPVTPSLSMEPGTRRANVKRALEYTGIPRYYEDYKEMLDTETFDIMIVCSENALHGEIIEEVASHNIHIVLEKPMATTYSMALKMARAAEKANVSLAVNWPTTWWPTIRKAQKLVMDGEIGKVWKFHYRNSASLGPLSYGQQVTDKEKGAEWWYQAEMGGGAYFDYCCYGACLSRWYINEPAVGAYGIRANFQSTYGDADDNGAIMVQFPNAIATLEGSWTTIHPGTPHGPIVYGDKGTLVCDNSKDGGIFVYKQKGKNEPTAVYHGEPLPKGRETIAKEFIYHLETGEPLHPTLDIPVNVDAMAILDAGLRSAANRKFETAKNVHWNIG